METLLAPLKAELRITWADEDADLTRLLVRGGKVINRLIGQELTYTEEGPATELLFTYVRYSRNNVAELFTANNQDLITSLSLEMGAEAYALELESELS